MIKGELFYGLSFVTFRQFSAVCSSGLAQRFSNFWCYGAHEEVDHYVRSPKINL